MNNKGLSVVELIVSFVLCILVFVFIIQVVISIEELYVNLGIKTELLNKQSLISENMNNKFIKNNIVLIKNCGENCLTFFYKDNTSEKMFINKETNTFTFGKDAYSFDGLGFVDELSISVSDDKIYKQAIFKINLNIKNSIFENGKYVIKAIHQYDINETVYSRSAADKAEILLLGPAISYKFSEDVFIETGWMVYYPDGTITINEDDVLPGVIEFDKEGNGAITYTGINAASGATASRVIKNYETAKARISNLYEKSANSNIYLYSEIGKYVYKGSNPDNYIVIGSKMFRILSLDVQNGYATDDNGQLIYDANGDKVIESKHLLKVVSEDLITDSLGNSILPYGTETTGILANNSCWMVSPDATLYDFEDRATCRYKDGTVNLVQNINTIVNNNWLQALLNTGTGRVQIKNGAFNVGVVDYDDFPFAVVPPRTGSPTIKNVYDAEATLKWSGNCMEDLCPPNAGIISLTDVILASDNANCKDTIYITIEGENKTVPCVYNNWLWSQQNQRTYRTMTRSIYNSTSTWIINEENNSFQLNSIGDEFRTRGTLYLDANLYILGTGTVDNPYSLYTIAK